VALVGGHSIKDDEVKLGFAITGVIDAKEAAALDAPQPGDVLVLTKPLGTGVLAFAQQIGRGHAQGMQQAAASMAMLNRPAAEAMREAGASACTDITGFGLFGHLVRMMRQRMLTARLYASELPAFDGVFDLLRGEVIPGAIERNREFVGDDLQVEAGVDEVFIHLGADAQTSGGLLVAIAPEKLGFLQKGLQSRGVEGVVIGRIESQSAARIILGNRRPEAVPAQTNQRQSMNVEAAPESHERGCCSESFGQAPAASSAEESRRAFGAWMRSAQAGGALNEKTKELLFLSLILQSRCGPCFKAHYLRARELGVTQAELDEAAWCAVAMGGAPVKMFYQEMLATVR